MKCPHCEYEDTNDCPRPNNLGGIEGNFYKLPVKLERENDYRDEQVPLYGCPSCKKVFLGDRW